MIEEDLSKMIEEDKKIEVKETQAEVKSNVSKLELYSESYPFALPLKIKTFENDADFTKFIKACEKMIRTSLEYKSWRNYIVDVLQINKCMVTNERMDECTIEVHHHVPSLYTVTKAVLNKYLETEEAFSSFDISMEVIEMHFKNRIGYVTLLKSMHEKFHNGFLHVPASFIKGDYSYFIEKYSKYLDDEDLETINERLSITETNCGWLKDEYPSAIAQSGGN